MKEAAGHLGVSVGCLQTTMLNLKKNIWLNSSAKRSLPSAHSDTGIEAMVEDLPDL
jgi:hypothetical protein